MSSKTAAGEGLARFLTPLEDLIALKDGLLEAGSVENEIAAARVTLAELQGQQALAKEQADAYAAAGASAREAAAALNETTAAKIADAQVEANGILARANDAAAAKIAEAERGVADRIEEWKGRLAEYVALADEALARRDAALAEAEAAEKRKADAEAALAAIRTKIGG